MTYGITTYRANGSVASSGATKAGIFIEVLTIPWNSSAGNKVYTAIPSGSLYYFTMQNPGVMSITVDSDGAGHARVNWSPGGGPAVNVLLVIFAKKVNQTSAFGAVINNDDGDMALDITYPVPQYYGTYQVPTTSVWSNVSPDGTGTCAVYQVQIPTSNRNRIALVNMPSSGYGTANVWYSFDLTSIPAGAADTVNGVKQNYVTGTLRILWYDSQVKVPTIHVFSLDGPVSGGGSYGLQYHDASGKLVYDSSAENISISNFLNITYQDTESQTTITMPTTLGIAIPYYQYRNYVSQPADQNGNVIDEQVSFGMMCRINSTLYWNTLLFRHDYWGSNISPHTEQDGWYLNNSAFVVDLSQLSAAYS